MDRIIDVKVGGNYISKDNKNAGVRGEANVTRLRITFDEGWDEYAKTVTFWDARGENPVERILTTDLLENKAESIRVYLVPIPSEPMAEAGSMTFVIDGYIEGKRQRSVSDKLEVKDAPMTDNAEEPTEPIPKPYEQFQQQIDAIKKDIQDTAKAKEEIENMNVSCETLPPGEDAFAEKVGEEGINLHFGIPAGEKGEKGDKGDTPEKGVDYWIDDDKAEIIQYATERVDEKTQILQNDIEGLQKQINEESHFRGYLSTNAKIEALTATPNDFAYSAESGTKWVYDAVDGWYNTGAPVPDQLTPASDTTPLINGVASVGSENAYARGDHRHPTDTTRASAEEVDELRRNLGNKIDKNSESIALVNGNSKTLIAYDGITAGTSFNINMNGGMISSCLEAQIEVLRYWDDQARKWVDVKETIGDIETALDNIIAIQNSLIGGES